VPRATLRALARQYATYGTYRVKTARRHPETFRRSQLLPPLVTLTAATACAAPSGRLRSLARAGVATYAGALAVSAARADHGTRTEAAALPAVWAVMHLSYGIGFVRGCARYGVPLDAVGQAVLGP
jgi:hypothetical protein